MNLGFGIRSKTTQGLRGWGEWAARRPQPESEKSACRFTEIRHLPRVFALGEKHQTFGERETDSTVAVLCSVDFYTTAPDYPFKNMHSFF